MLNDSRESSKDHFERRDQLEWDGDDDDVHVNDLITTRTCE